MQVHPNVGMPFGSDSDGTAFVADICGTSLASSNVDKPAKLKRARATPKSHPECTKCSLVHKKSKTPGEPSPWARFLKTFKSQHPDMSADQVMREARKRYVPPSGKPKSFERIYREIWRAKNHTWKDLYPDPEDAKKKMREDFVEAI